MLAATATLLPALSTLLGAFSSESDQRLLAKFGYGGVGVQQSGVSTVSLSSRECVFAPFSPPPSFLQVCARQGRVGGRWLTAAARSLLPSGGPQGGVSPEQRLGGGRSLAGAVFAACQRSLALSKRMRTPALLEPRHPLATIPMPTRTPCRERSRSLTAFLRALGFYAAGCRLCSTDLVGGRRSPFGADASTWAAAGVDGRGSIAGWGGGVFACL
jgi:hypothetical protein